jgi:hypothetical protein
LPNVRPKASRVQPLERSLFALHSFLKELPSVIPQHPLEAARKLLKKGVAVPYSLPLPTEETNWKVAFEPPSDINLVGSWANKVSVKPKDGNKFGVDLAVEMPNVSVLSIKFVVILMSVEESVPGKRLPQWSFLPQTSLLSGHYRCCDTKIQKS